MNLNKLITKFVDYARRVMFAPGRKRTCAFPRVMVAQIDEARLLKGNDEYASGGASLHQECCQFTNEC